MDKRQAQLAAARRKQAWRKDKAYTLAKQIAAAAGVALPSARNGGGEFDAWLKEAILSADGETCPHCEANTVDNVCVNLNCDGGVFRHR